MWGGSWLCVRDVCAACKGFQQWNNQGCFETTGHSIFLLLLLPSLLHVTITPREKTQWNFTAFLSCLSVAWGRYSEVLLHPVVLTLLFLFTLGSCVSISFSKGSRFYLPPSSQVIYNFKIFLGMLLTANLWYLPAAARLPRPSAVPCKHHHILFHPRDHASPILVTQLSHLSLQFQGSCIFQQHLSCILQSHTLLHVRKGFSA